MKAPHLRLIQSVSEHRLELPAHRSWWREWGAALVQAGGLMVLPLVVFVVTLAFLIVKAAGWVCR